VCDLSGVQAWHLWLPGSDEEDDPGWFGLLPALGPHAAEWSWPYSLGYTTTGHWTHPEFAVNDDVPIEHGAGLKVSFVSHFKRCVTLGDYHCPDPNANGLGHFIKLANEEKKKDKHFIKALGDFQANFGEPFNGEDWKIICEELSIIKDETRKRDADAALAAATEGAEDEPREEPDDQERRSDSKRRKGDSEPKGKEKADDDYYEHDDEGEALAHAPGK
jgi:hypothetical protein